jgi:hypothetical protein
MWALPLAVGDVGAVAQLDSLGEWAYRTGGPRDPVGGKRLQTGTIVKQSSGTIGTRPSGGGMQRHLTWPPWSPLSLPPCQWQWKSA